MNIDWQKIKTDYPMAYAKMIKYEKVINKYYYNFFYEDLETFFDSVEIIITIHYNLKKFWFGIYFNKDDYFQEDLEKEYISRHEAKEQAVYKSFEIYNEELKNERK